MKNPSIFGSSQKRGVLIPICSRFESVTFRESEAILTLPEVCQQSVPGLSRPGFSFSDQKASCCQRRHTLKNCGLLLAVTHLQSPFRIKAPFRFPASHFPAGAYDKERYGCPGNSPGHFWQAPQLLSPFAHPQAP
ncbi:hypothetical protein [Brucella vulpis]|uniref:hypothetical protein n=1 Tax=Brucella vulpis TaxID=981386 RepID=UPI004032C155